MTQSLFNAASSHLCDGPYVLTERPSIYGPEIPLAIRIDRALVLKPLFDRRSNIASPKHYARKRLDAALESVERLNGCLQRFSFGGIEPPVFRRLFVYSLSLGGRFHTSGAGSFSTLSKEARRRITIDGQPVVEIDIQASGPTILLALLDPSRLPPLGVDLYALPGLPRAAVKAAMVSALARGRMPSKWSPTVSPAVRTVPFEVVRDAVLEEYPAFDQMVNVLPETLSRELSRNGRHAAVGHYINAKESRIMVLALRALHDEGIAALPLHDGLVVPEGFAEVARDVLVGTFGAQLGVRPNVTVTRAEGS